MVSLDFIILCVFFYKYFMCLYSFEFGSCISIFNKPNISRSLDITLLLTPKCSVCESMFQYTYGWMDEKQQKMCVYGVNYNVMKSDSCAWENRFLVELV